MALLGARAAFGGIRQQSVESQPALSQIDGAKLPLLKPYQLGQFKLSHRVALAPLTSLNTPLFTTRNEQPRVVFLITEATCVSETGIGYPCVPGIWTQEQILAWKPIVEAVHAKGGIFFCQLWHAGRRSHTSFEPNGAPPPSSTNQPIRRSGKIYTKDGKLDDAPQPRAIETHEVPLIAEEFAQAARNAIDAGFDGIELHGANGYLIDQFLRDGANNRTDKYGGAIENRCRFLVEIVEAVGNAIGFERVGVRISPFADIADVTDSNPLALSLHIAEVLSPLNILYLHVIEPRLSFAAGAESVFFDDQLVPIRKAYKGPFIAGGGYTRESGNQAIESGKADLIVYGRFFLANPDLPKRFALNAPLNKYDRKTFYTHDPVLGYTDYPFLEDVVKTESGF